MKKFWQWIKNKFGRIVTTLGVLLGGIDAFDISAIKDPVVNLLGNKAFQVATILCFAASWARHQLVANKHPTPPPQ